MYDAKRNGNEMIFNKIYIYTQFEERFLISSCDIYFFINEPSLSFLLLLRTARCLGFWKYK